MATRRKKGSTPNNGAAALAARIITVLRESPRRSSWPEGFASRVTAGKPVGGADQRAERRLATNLEIALQALVGAGHARHKDNGTYTATSRGASATMTEAKRAVGARRRRRGPEAGGTWVEPFVVEQMRTVPDGTEALRWAVLGAAATAAGGHHSDPDVDAAIRRRKGQRGAKTKKQGAVILNNAPTGIGKAYQIAEALGDAYERVLTGKIAPGLVAYVVTPMNYQREEIRQALDAR